MRVFVTVGTTRFDSLVSKILEDETLDILKTKFGCSELVLQIGASEVGRKRDKIGLNLEVFKFKASLKEDIARADLVISHAGSGTCLEVLELRKPLIVVVNEDLMGNHQTELADKLNELKVVKSTNVRNLREVLLEFDEKNSKKFPQGDLRAFAFRVNKLMNV